MEKEFTKADLNRVTHSVRTVQAVLQYGVGAMVDFPEQTLMTAAPEYWKDQITEIYDDRLARVLHVDYFGIPVGEDDPKCKRGISYVRFPEWYFCPKCRRFQPIKAWITEYRQRKRQNKKVSYDQNMVNHPRCPMCRQDLVVARIVTVCKCGHIDDFPWEKWVHCKNMKGPVPICERPKLTFKTNAASGEGLEGLTITCETCHAKATLRGAFDKGVFQKLDEEFGNKYGFKCTGRHPWKNTTETCDAYPKVLQRGSSAVYFPSIESSLVIPPYSSLITKSIEESTAFLNAKSGLEALKKNRVVPQAMLPSIIQRHIETTAEEIARETGIAEGKIKPVLERKWLHPENVEEYSTNSVKYRSEEYAALSGEIAVPADEYGDFFREGTNIADYKIPYIKGISLIHKVREVQALVGFSRLDPSEASADGKTSGNVVSIKKHGENWYPAYEVRGEGIFIEFDEEDIAEWQKNNPKIRERVDTLNSNYEKSYIGKSRHREITAKFLLLHTISHALIKQLSFECGYSIASLKERLYCSELDEGRKMAGILIYTASGDSEGTMGGLVRQGRADTFPHLFKKAIETATVCSNDPVCSLSMGQGRDSLNLSACHSCSLIPETSCEQFNIFLDRGMIAGTYKDREIGFYSKQLYGVIPWTGTETKSAETAEGKKDAPKILIADSGVDLKEYSYSDIWENMLEWAENSDEKALLSELLNMADKFADREKPHKDCVFRIIGDAEQYTCDLYWKDSQVAIFTAGAEDGYALAKKSGMCCFLTTDASISPEEILKAIKKK